MKRSIALVVSAVIGLSVAAAMAQTKPASTAAPAKPTPAATQAKPAAAPAKAPAPAGDAAIRASIAKAVPGAEITSIKPSLIPGYREVAIGGAHRLRQRRRQVPDAGRAVRHRAAAKTSPRPAKRCCARAVLDAVPRDRRIVFAPANPKYRVTVFTDIECGYCRKLHTQIADYNKPGIAVEYLFFPRMGLGCESFNKMVSVWCAATAARR